MTRALLAFCVLLACLPVGRALAQPSEQDGRPTVRIQGRVISAQTGAPLKGAKVSLAEQGGTVSAYSSFDGSFVLEDVPVGDPFLQVFKSGYGDWMQRIRVAAQAPRRMEVRLNRLAVISGRVLDNAGRPVVGAKVGALQRYLENGRYIFVHSFGGRGGFQTDDRGIYRLYGLPPGDYLVAVSPSVEPGLRGEFRFASMPRLYPNATRFSDAARLPLRWGEEKLGVDLVLLPAPSTRVRGQVVLADVADACAQCYVQVYQTDGESFQQLVYAQTTAQGEFTLLGLPPGEYAAAVDALMRSSGTFYLGAERFTVSESRPSAVVVEAYGERIIRAKLVLRDPPDELVTDDDGWSAHLRLEAPPFDPTAGRRTRGGDVAVNEKGPEAAIEFSVFPGRYRLETYGLPENGYLAGIAIGARTLAGPEVAVPPQGFTEEMILTIRFDSGAVQGTVDQADSNDAAQSALSPASWAPSSSGAVWLIPEGGPEGFRTVRYGGIQPDGSFTVRGVPPGVYTAFAYPDHAGFRIDDPENQKKFAAYGQRLEVHTAETTAAGALRLLPRQRQ